MRTDPDHPRDSEPSVESEPAVEQPDDPAAQFERLAEQPQQGLIREFAAFLRENKKWWLAPILVALLLQMVIAYFAASPAAPFIYTLF